MPVKSPLNPELLKTVIANNRAAHRPPMRVVTIPVEDVKIGDRFRKDMGDLTDLKQSIEDIGLLNPITVLPDHTLVAGERRLAAFKALNRETIPARIIETLEDARAILRAERDENVARKSFTPLEMAAITEALLPEAERAARERKAAALKKGAENPRSGNFPEREKGEAIDEIASMVGVSGKTLRKIRQVVTSGSPELIRAMDQGEISVNSAAKQVATQPAPEPKESTASKQSFTGELAFNLSATLKDGTAVQIVVLTQSKQPLSSKQLKEALKLAKTSLVESE